VRQVGLEARRIDWRGTRLERHDVLRPEGSERCLHVGDGLRLAQAKAQLQALERAAERKRRIEREAFVLEREAALGRDARGNGRAERDMDEADLAQRIDRFGARDAQALDVDLPEAQAEGQERRLRGAPAAFADGDVQGADMQRLDHQAPAKRRGEMRMAADVARLHHGAVGVVAHAVDEHRGRERAARAFDVEVPARRVLGVRERPAQAGLGAEKPHNADQRSAYGRGDGGDSADEEMARSQKPYPTEKCNRQSLFLAP